MTALDCIAGADWAAVDAALNERGYAVIRQVFDEADCERTQSLYDQAALFRSRVVMARHGFGQGEYQYFGYPLPEQITAMRDVLYARLAPIANAWAGMLGSEALYPATLSSFLEVCHGHGQLRPTPLLLKYGPGDYNRLHQDLYGGIHFPLQVAVLLSAADEFNGGEFVLTETAPRRQTRAEVVQLAQGDMIIFAVNHRPIKSAKGFSRVAMRHGVSTVHSGARMTLGVIFHDAT